MTMREIEEPAFGQNIKGIEIRMSLEEAKNVATMLGQGFAHPPTVPGGNVDYKAKEVVHPLVRFLRTVTEKI